MSRTEKEILRDALTFADLTGVDGLDGHSAASAGELTNAEIISARSRLANLFADDTSASPSPSSPGKTSAALSAVVQDSEPVLADQAAVIDQPVLNKVCFSTAVSCYRCEDEVGQYRARGKFGLVLIPKADNHIIRALKGTENSCMVLSQGEGNQVSIGDSILVESTKFYSTTNGEIKKGDTIETFKLKLTKRPKDVEIEPHFMGMRKNERKILAVSTGTKLRIVSLTLKKVKFALKRKSDGEHQERSQSPSSQSEQTTPRDDHDRATQIDEKLPIAAPRTTSHDALLSRIARIGQPILRIPQPLDSQGQTVDTNRRSEDCAVSAVVDELRAQKPNEEVNASSADAMIQNTPPKSDNFNCIGLQKENNRSPLAPDFDAMQRFMALEMDRLHNRIEMSLSRIVQEQLTPLMMEFRAFRREEQENRQVLLQKLTDISAKLEQIGHSTINQPSSPSQLDDSMMAKICELFADRDHGYSPTELREMLDQLARPCDHH